MDLSRQQGEPNPVDMQAEAGALHGQPGRQPPLAPARTLLGALARTARFDAALAMTAPAAAATAAAWWQAGALNIFAAAFILAAAFSAGLGIHLLIEYHNRLRAQDPQVRVALAFINGKQSPKAPELLLGQIRSLGYMALLISFVCSLWLGVLIGWPLVLFNVATLALGITYAAPPVRYGARGFGLGESGLFIALGLLPAFSSYYAQLGTIDALALWSGVPFAMLVSLMGVTYNLFNYRRDWLIRQRTLAVLLGPARAIDLSTILLIGAFVFILFASVVSTLPLRTMVALLALPIATSAYARIDREQLPPAEGMRLYWASINVTLVTCLLYCLSLLTDRLL